MAIERAHSHPPKPQARPEISEQGLEQLSEEERRLYSLLVPAHKRSAIPLSRFEGLYDKGMITDDARYVEKMEEVFRREESPETAQFQRRAELLEAIARDEIKHDAWLGNEAKPITASRYDDIKNGIDLIIEFFKDENLEEVDSILGLSVDITSNTNSLEEKLSKIKNGILSGQLAYVKYFISSTGGRREIPKVPKVVIGIDDNSIRELSLLRLEIHGLAHALKENESSGRMSSESVQSSKSRFTEARLKLAKHRVQLLFLDQIETQLRIFSDFASRNGQPQLSKEYERALAKIQDIKKEKSNPNDKSGITLSPEEKESNENDGVNKALKVGLKIFE